MANPSLYDPSMIVSGLIGVALTEMWQAAKDATIRQEMIKRFRHKYGLENDETIQSFDAFYGLSLIEFSVGRERVAFEIFKNSYVRDAFEHFFRTRDDEQLRKEVDEIVSLKEEVGATKGREYDYRRDIEPFKQTFFALLERYRAPQVVMLHHHMDDIQQSISELKEHRQNQQAPILESNVHASPIVAPLRWLHLSDFHVGEKKDEKTQLFQQILDDIRAHQSAGKGPDLIFITGDIVGLAPEEKESLSTFGEMDDEESAAYTATLTNSLQSRYETFTDGFLFPLIDCVGEDKIFMVPGDQDIHPLEGTLLKKHGLLKDDPRFLKLTSKAKELRQQYCSRFHIYVDNDILEGRQDHWLSSTSGMKVEQRTLHGMRVGVLLTNTAWLAEGVKGKSDEERKRDMGQLSPGKEMIREGLRQLEHCDVRFVLGHHPVEWFIEEEGCRERSGIRDLFKEYHVLYLHGHLVKNAEDPIDAKFFYQSMAAGASFITNNKDLWRTRVLWCELEPETRSQVTVEPLLWERDNPTAKVDRSAIPLNVRERLTQNTFHLSLLMEDESEETKGVPTGWKHVTLSYLDKYRESTPDDMLHYFDGRRPNWKEILAPHIEKRKQVNDLITHLAGIRASDEVKVTAFIGPSGEGKSTIVQQVVRTLVESQDGWHVWWREDNTCSLPSSEVERISSKNGAYLIVADDGESVVEDVYKLADKLIKQGRRNIQFLLCCRTIDWDMAEKSIERNLRIPRPKFVDEIKIASLSREDAKLVVEAWTTYGSLGKQLQNMLPEQATTTLMQAARADNGIYSDEGALLGAMLDVRYSPEELLARIHELLLHMKSKTVSGSKKTLQNAFAYIAAAHVRNLPLPPEVLAELFKLDPDEGNDIIEKELINPLCDEAFINTTSRYMYIRHRKIAENILGIVAGDKHGPMSEQQLYSEMLEKTSNVFHSGRFAPDGKRWSGGDVKAINGDTRNAWINSWNRLPDEVFETNRDMAIELMYILLKAEPKNLHFYVKLSQLRRKRDKPNDWEQSRDTFIEVLEKVFDEDRTVESQYRDSFYQKVMRDRAFFYEWATSLGAHKNHEEYRVGAWLSGLSLADALIQGTPEQKLAEREYDIEKRVRESLIGLSVAFRNLYTAHKDEQIAAINFACACAAVAFLALRYLDLRADEESEMNKSKQISIRQGIDVNSVKKAIDLLTIGIKNAWELVQPDERMVWLGVGEAILVPGNELQFERLRDWFTQRDGKNRKRET